MQGVLATEPFEVGVRASLSGGALVAVVVASLAIGVLLVASFWRIYTKAGQEGWKSIVPIYNVMVLAEIVGRPPAWGLLTLIPFAGAIFAIILYVELARAFGKGGGYAAGMIFLAFIFLPMLAFGCARYRPPRR